MDHGEPRNGAIAGTLLVIKKYIVFSEGKCMIITL